MKITIIFFATLYSFTLLGAPGVSLPAYKTHYYGDELASKFFPSDPQIRNLFSDFANLDVLRITTTPPEGRNMGMIDGDLLHQQGIQILINRKKIQKGTLIISNTGHDIPLAAQLLKNTFFSTQVVFHLPKELNDPGTFERLTNQAQDWAQEIKEYQNNYLITGPDIIFIGLEGHRREYNGDFLYKIDIETLPTREELISLGISKVIYIHERHPDATEEIVKQAVPADIRPYLDNLNLPVSYLGADCRREQGCGWKPLCLTDDPSCGWKEEFGY